MFTTFLSVLGAIFILLILIVVHEAGHFFAARFFGMQTPVVGLGLPFFGPTWKVFKFQDIEFRFHPVLLGAYVAIPEMDDESADEELGIKLEKPKRQFPAWQRMIVSFAGPGANFVFAFILALATVIFIGVPDTSIAKTEAFFVQSVSAQASEEVKSNLKQGDQLLSVNGIVTKNRNEFIENIKSRPNQPVSIWLERQGKVCLPVEVGVDSGGKLNIALNSAPNYVPVEGTPVISHLSWAWQYFSEWFMRVMQGLWFFLSAPFRQDGNGPKITEVHGIFFATGIIAEYLKESLKSGFYWGALISIELGIFNLLPILPLDGGHILFQFGEIVTSGQKMNRVRQYVAQFGLTLFLLLTCLILFNDFRDILFPAK